MEDEQKVDEQITPEADNTTADEVNPEVPAEETPEEVPANDE